VVTVTPPFIHLSFTFGQRTSNHDGPIDRPVTDRHRKPDGAREETPEAVSASAGR